MDEIKKIRKLFKEGESRNGLAIRFNRSWETINKIVSTEIEILASRVNHRNREAKVITPTILKEIESYLEEEVQKKVKKKQRYTARKIFNELKEKGIYEGSERRIQDTVRRLREERNQSKKQSYLPLSFTLGSSLQIDHGEVDLVIDGSRLKGYLFIASVPGYALRYCQAFPIKSQEAWGEFHRRTISFFGGTFDKFVYDNDSVLIKKVIGNERNQTIFSLSLEEHFGFESHFCNVASGNEKGAVENGVGYCRRNFLPGCPDFSDWDILNQYLEANCKKDIENGKHYKSNRKLKEIFIELKENLSPLPTERYWFKRVNSRVNSCQLVTVDCHDYSVPEKYVGTNVQVDLGVFDLKIFKDEELVAIHKRQYGEDDSLKLDHYLDQLKYKSSAFWDCKAVSNHKFDEQFLEIWNRLSIKHPKREANKHFVRILLLGRRFSNEDLLKSIEIALKYGAVEHSAVENILLQRDKKKLIFNEEELSKSLKSVEVQSFKFDLSQYADLCKGGVL